MFISLLCGFLGFCLIVCFTVLIGWVWVWFFCFVFFLLVGFCFVSFCNWFCLLSSTRTWLLFLESQHVSVHGVLVTVVSIWGETRALRDLLPKSGSEFRANPPVVFINCC